MKSDIDKDIEKVNKLWYLLDDVYSTGLIENEERDEYQQALGNVLKELETYKKIEDFMADFIVENIDRIDTKPWCRLLVYDSSSKWLSSGKKKKSL